MTITLGINKTMTSYAQAKESKPNKKQTSFGSVPQMKGLPQTARPVLKKLSFGSGSQFSIIDQFTPELKEVIEKNKMDYAKALNVYDDASTASQYRINEPITLPRVEKVTINTQQGPIKSLYVEPEEGKPTVLYVHENNTNVIASQDAVKPLAEKGYGVLMLEPAGFGENAKYGTPTRENIEANVLDGIKFLNEEKNTPNNNIVAMGHGLGGYFASHAAVKAETPLKAVILDSTPPNLAGLFEYFSEAGAIESSGQLDSYKQQGQLRKGIGADLLKNAGLHKVDVKAIPQETQVAVIASQSDSQVPSELTQQLMDQVKKEKENPTVLMDQKSTNSKDDEDNVKLAHFEFGPRAQLASDFLSKL